MLLKRSCNTHIKKSLGDLYYLYNKVINLFMQNIVSCREKNECDIVLASKGLLIN